MARVIWKGAITFGLVHVPIVLHSATRVSRLDFDWIDKRDNARAPEPLAWACKHDPDTHTKSVSN